MYGFPSFLSSRRRARPALLLLFLCAGLSLAQGQRLKPSWQLGSYASAFSTTRTFPRLSNGFLVSFTRIIRQGAPSNIVVTSLYWDKQWQVPFASSDGSEIVLHDAAIAQGNLLIAGSKSSSGSNSSFVAEVTFNGELISMVNLGSYVPTRVCATGDDSFWALGSDGVSGSALLRN